MQDVIIVGAGFAGLSAALALKEQGLSFLVLEARVRIGGRCQTGEVRGESLDVGGHWINRDLQKRVSKLFSDRGYKFKAQFDEGTHILSMFGSRYTYQGNISSLKSFGKILEESGKLIATFDADMSTIPLEDPTKCPRAKEWDSMTLKEWQDKNIESKEARQLLDFLVWTIFTVKAEELSYLFWLFYLKQGHGYVTLSDIRGGAQQDKVVGGCQQLLEHIVARDLGANKVLLRTPVRSIEQKDGFVICTAANGSQYRAARVIVTAPPPVCSDISFVPSLSPARNELHKLYKLGTVIKVYVLYKTHWWRARNMSGEMLSDREPVTLYYDATTETVPGLIGFIPAHLAKKWSKVPVDQLKEAIVKQLVEEFGVPEAGKPEEVLVRPWLADDVWCKGGYSGSMGPNVLSKYGNILRTPEGRIHWAGTELALDWAGYFEGAVESGQRAAKEVAAALSQRAKL